jgi:hypothetical protein
VVASSLLRAQISDWKGETDGLWNEEVWQEVWREEEMKKPVFKPCSKCPYPAKCKAAGKCLGKAK